MISRRHMLKSASAMMLATVAGMPFRAAFAQSAPGRVVVNVMLAGGADLRQLLVPDPTVNRPYAEAFWKARAALTGQSGLLSTYQSVYAGQYTAVSVNGQTLGVHNAATWLIDRLRDGKAAIVANVAGSDNRQHQHSQLIWRVGDATASPWDLDRDGWGGRLVYTIASANAISVSPTPSVFAQGLEAGRRNARAIHIPDPRLFALDESNAGPYGGVVAKSLTGYYAGKQSDAAAKPATWPFHRILQHEANLRSLGRSLNTRLAALAPTRPEPLRLLYQGLPGTRLINADFGKQCAALFDCAVAGSVLNMRAAYMEMGGWDTHTGQVAQLNNNFSDLFGLNKGLATLSAELAKFGLTSDIVFVITSEFGRQIVANTRGGTEHGRGSYTIVIGDGVRGGLFGEMFPDREIAGAVGKRPLDIDGSDILGQTSFEHVLGEVCDWVAAGSGDTVFPGRSTAILEPGVDLSTLFA